MNAIPIYEAKNKLPLFIHKAETDGPIFISRHNKNAAVILSFDDYTRLISKQKKPTILEKAAELRKKLNMTNEEVDAIFDVRDRSTHGTSWEDDIFKGIFED